HHTPTPYTYHLSLHDALPIFFLVPFVHTRHYNSSHQNPTIQSSICGSTEKKIHTRQQNLADFYCKLSKPPLTFPGHPPDFPRKHQTINRKRKAWQSANGYNLELIFVYAVRLIVSAYEKVRLFVLLDVGFRSENKA